MASQSPSGYRLKIVPEVREWLHQLRRSDPETLEHISEAIRRLTERGPALARPTADLVKGSRYAMKELRPRSGQRVSVRILFVFDPVRQAVILTAGNKAGRDTPAGNLYLQKPHDTRRFDQLFGQLRGAALDAEQGSIGFLRALLKEK